MKILKYNRHTEKWVEVEICRSIPEMTEGKINVILSEQDADSIRKSLIYYWPAIQIYRLC